MLPSVYSRVGRHKLLLQSAPLIVNTIVRKFGDRNEMVSKSYDVLKKKANISSRSPDTVQIENSKKTVYMALGGNMIITASKVAAYLFSGSSVMLSEAIHSLVDSGNQALLLIGLTAADSEADGKYQYGYGKSVYFWSLVSALGTFWCGAGVSGWSSMQALISPSVELHAIGWEIWSVLGVAFAVDGAVLYKTVQKVNLTRPPNVSLFSHITNIRDPTTAAVLWEDAAACGGVLIAVGGISLVSLTHLVVFDALAGLAVSGLLASMGIYLARMNKTYLMGQAVEPEITDGIKKILMAGKSIDEVHSVQSQWVGPYSFSYKAEVDFDGTYIAAKLLDRYQSEFSKTHEMGERSLIFSFITALSDTFSLLHVYFQTQTRFACFSRGMLRMCSVPWRWRSKGWKLVSDCGTLRRGTLS